MTLWLTYKSTTPARPPLISDGKKLRPPLKRRDPPSQKADPPLIGGPKIFEPGFGCTIADAVVGSCSAYPFFKEKFVTTARGDRIQVRDGGFVANNPTLYTIADATVAFGHAHEDVRLVSLGVGEYPEPKLPATSARKWLSKWPTVKFSQRLLEINTQSMEERRCSSAKFLFEEGVCRARTHYCVGDGAAEARLKSPRARVRLASPKPLRGKPRGARD